MKLKYITITFLLCTSTLFIQESKTDLLCGKKWEMKFLEIDNQKIPVPESEFSFWLFFKKDGTQKMNTEDGIAEATWKFSKNQDSILVTVSNGVKRNFALNKLEKNELILSIKQGRESAIMYLKPLLK